MTLSPKETQLDPRSIELRKTIVKIIAAARRGHIGSAFSVLDILRVLYDDILKFDATRPDWPERDRMILSKGHGCLALYAVLADKGYFPEAELWKFCSKDGILGGHPERSKVPGVEASTGSLGHGPSVGVGLALALRLKKNLTSRVFVVTGDGELNEGEVWEACLSASKHHLDWLCLVVDYNKQQSYSTTAEVLELEPLADKFRAFGFATREVNGHDVAELKAVLSATPFETGKPTAIICHTVKGKGIPMAEGNLSWHHKAKVSDDEIAMLQAALEEKH